MREDRYSERHRREQFSENLSEILDAQGMTQAWLAEQIGVPPQYVSRWLSADSAPRLGTICQISDVVGHSVGELIEDPEFQSMDAWSDPILNAASLCLYMLQGDNPFYKGAFIGIHAAYRLFKDVTESAADEGMEFIKYPEDYELYGEIMNLLTTYKEKVERRRKMHGEKEKPII